MRLDRLIARLSGKGRNFARREIASGKVSVAGQIVTDGQRQIGSFETVLLGETIVQQRIPRNVLLHKPAGILCATTDPVHPTVIGLIAEPWAEELHLAGRLDRASTGLVILTNDSSFSESLTRPGAHVPKTYLVTLDQPVPEEVTAAFKKGIHFEKEGITTQSAAVELLDSGHVRLTIYEGIHHQIKRMFARFGIRVTALHRESVGPYCLSPELPVGVYASFTPEDACEEK